MNDTSKEAEKIQIELLRQAGFQRRLALTYSWSSAMRQLSMEGLQRANPTLSKLEVGIKFVEINYGAELAEKLKKYVDANRNL